MNALTIFLVALGALAGWVMLAFNRFVTLRNRVKEAFADIDVQLKRRYDMIPNLVNTVQGYAAHERGVFEKVTEARARAMGATAVEDRAHAENMLSQTLKSLFAVAENYPDLKASERFGQLMAELRDTEDKIQAARRFYNTNVLALNTQVETVPSNLIASMFGFKKEAFFEIEEKTERQTPQVKF